MMRNYSDEELFPLSWLSQYGYCPRRCGLIAIDGEWAENADTVAGRHQHERVHAARVERRGEDIFLYELGVFSKTLGVSGKCDCVEARQCPSGVNLPYGGGTYLLYPIEYKHGVVRQVEEYHIQLCAQAMCLEEQFGGKIEAGAIYYANAKRRNEVRLTRELRRKTSETAEAVLSMLNDQAVPAAMYSAKCKKCSMSEICSPKLKRSAAAYCKRLWDITTAEGEDEAY